MDLITIKHEGGLCFSVQVRGHRFLADMPKDSQGEDRGPSPADLLTAALGACMGMHMVLYCQTAGINSQGMEMSVVYNLVEEKGHRRISVVTGDVTLLQDPGPRKAALLRASENCIIRNTLVNPPKIDLEITSATPEKTEG
jgi:putative redox protein